MKGLLLYGSTLLAAGMLSYLSGLWFEGDKVLGIVAIVLFASFLQSWKRVGTSGLGIAISTAFLLFTLDSIFFVQDILTFIYSLVMGILLIPQYGKNRDGVAASLVFVFLNMLICLEFVPSEIMMWLIAFATGAAALIGFRYSFSIVKIIFGVLFSLAALFLLLVQLFDGNPVLSVLSVLSIAFFAIGMIRLNGKVAA